VRTKNPTAYSFKDPTMERNTSWSLVGLWLFSSFSSGGDLTSSSLSLPVYPAKNNAKADTRAFAFGSLLNSYKEGVYAHSPLVHHIDDCHAVDDST
jgi:hypothetical protein